MMYCLSLELKKTRRRGIWLVLAALLITISLWVGGTMNDARFLGFGWMMALYSLPIVNAVLIPTGIAVFASRIIDMEHKGNTWKLLETLEGKFELYAAKVLYGLIAVLFFSIAELLLYATIGFALGFEGTPDLWAYGLFFVQTFAVTLNLYLLQMLLSLIFTNQAVALCVGLCGSLAGLFLMYIPQWSILKNIIPWGHYGAMMFVGMDWNKAQGIKGFYYMQQENGALFFVVGWFLFLIIGGWFAFKKMDTDGFHFDLIRDAQSTKPITIPSAPVEILK
ncbi:MAG: ABC transporter permease [Lachnospiraceae bacterium]|nr:ABC transporter permease [Lachnospiraceae bacterium]